MLSYYSYHIPFKNTFKIAGREFSHRNGIILVFRENNFEAYGEIAPLPGFSNETLEKITEILRLNKTHIESSLYAGNGDEVLSVLTQIHQFPSLSFGLDTLFHDLAAKRKNLPLYKYLFPDLKSNHLITNGTLSVQHPEKTIKHAQVLVDEGYSTIKMKVGINFNLELEILKKLHAEFPNIKFRIDANEAWQVDEAIHNLNQLERLNIEYCEQPVSAKDSALLSSVKKAANVPIAADEFVRNKSSVEELLKQKAADLIIIKPMLMGTFNNIFVTNDLANTHNIEVVYTTLLESAVGRAATIVIAAGSGNDLRAHGLSTGNMLTADVSPEKWLNKPEIIIPDKPGLGISLKMDRLTEV